MWDLARWGKKEIIIKCHSLTHANATFYISLNESKFIKEYKNKISKWSQYWKGKCTNLTWHDDQEVIFKKNCKKQKL